MLKDLKIIIKLNSDEVLVLRLTKTVKKGRAEVKQILTVGKLTCLTFNPQT